MKRKLIKCSHSNPQDQSYIFWCIGCMEYHAYMTSRSAENKAEIAKLLGRTDAPIWGFNGSMEKPTFSPSLLCKHRKWRKESDGGPYDHICHLFLVDGMIQYLTDCTHEYAGKTIPLQDEPE